MGAFHCPVGAVGMGSEDCIECGMCVAITKEEQKKAANLVREYLRGQADTRLERYVIQRIAVCGKGGVGKSTLSAMAAIALQDMGYEVLVIDMDESNAGLHRKLGFTDQELPKPLSSFLERFSGGEKQDTSWMDQEEIRMEDIPEEYMGSKGRLHFMMAGKIEDALQGCACSLADIVKILLSKLVVDKKQILIVDNEAGLESFGRGVERYMDTILVIVEASYESIRMAFDIKRMAEGMGIRRVRAILNKVSDEKTGKLMIKKLTEQDVKYLGVMKMDECIAAAGLMGEKTGECEAKEKFEGIMKLMLDEAEMKYNKI